MLIFLYILFLNSFTFLIRINYFSLHGIINTHIKKTIKIKQNKKREQKKQTHKKREKKTNTKKK